MPARRCFKCRTNWPATKGSGVKCPECDTVLQYTSHATPDAEWPPEIPEVLPSLEPDVQAEVDREWAALRDEARKRGPRWSVADLIAERGGNWAA